MYKGKYVDGDDVVDCFIYEGKQDEQALRDFCQNTKYDVVRCDSRSATIENKNTNSRDIIYSLTWLIKHPESNYVFLYDGHYDSNHKHLDQISNIYYFLDEMYSIVFSNGKKTVYSDKDTLPEIFDWAALSKKKYKEYCNNNNVAFVDEPRWQPKKNMDPGY